MSYDQMDWVAVLFVAGVLLGMIFGFRIFVRVYQLMHAWGRLSPDDPIADLFVPIRLRGTPFLDVVGWLISVIMCFAAVALFQVRSP